MLRLKPTLEISLTYYHYVPGVQVPIKTFTTDTGKLTTLFYHRNINY